MKWDIVTREHLVKACESLKAERMPATRLRTLVVVFQGQELSAKKVVKIAYCLANGIPIESNLKFASGEGTLNLLRRRGFEVKRLATNVSGGLDGN